MRWARDLGEHVEGVRQSEYERLKAESDAARASAQEETPAPAGEARAETEGAAPASVNPAETQPEQPSAPGAEAPTEQVPMQDGKVLWGTFSEKDAIGYLKSKGMSDEKISR